MSGPPPLPVGSVRRDDRAVADMHRLLDSAQRIVSRSLDTFTDPVDDTQYLAAKALIIDTQSAADRLSDSFRAAHADLPWRQLKRTRDKLGHHYLGIDKVMIWRVLAIEFPRIRQGLLEGPDASASGTPPGVAPLRRGVGRDEAGQDST